MNGILSLSTFFILLHFFRTFLSVSMKKQQFLFFIAFSRFLYCARARLLSLSVFSVCCSVYCSLPALCAHQIYIHIYKRHSNKLEKRTTTQKWIEKRRSLILAKINKDSMEFCVWIKKERKKPTKKYIGKQTELHTHCHYTCERIEEGRFISYSVCKQSTCKMFYIVEKKHEILSLSSDAMHVYMAQAKEWKNISKLCIKFERRLNESGSVGKTRLCAYVLHPFEPLTLVWMFTTVSFVCTRRSHSRVCVMCDRSVAPPITVHE